MHQSERKRTAPEPHVGPGSTVWYLPPDSPMAKYVLVCLMPDGKWTGAIITESGQARTDTPPSALDPQWVFYTQSGADHEAATRLSNDSLSKRPKRATSRGQRVSV